MNKIFLTLMALMLLIGCACTKSCQREKTASKVLKIGINPNFPPFETIDARGEPIGFDVDLARAIAKELGAEVSFKEFDFDALILALEKEQIDLIISGMSITASRQKEIAMIPYLGDPLTEISLLFWQNIPPEITSLSELKQLTLAKKLSVSLQSGHFFEDVLKGEGVPLKLLAGSTEQILDMKYGKSLAAAIDLSVAKKLSAEHHDLKLLTLPLPPEKWDLGNGIGIKKSRAELIKDIERIIAQFKSDGTLQKLKEKWFKDGGQ